MDLRALHYFVVVAEELNITRASERLSRRSPPRSRAWRKSWACSFSSGASGI